MARPGRIVGLVMSAAALAGCGDDRGADPAVAVEGPEVDEETAEDRGPSGISCEALPAGTEEVDITPEWEVGDGVELEVQTTRDDSGGESRDATVPVTITVREATGRGFELGWTQDLAPVPSAMLDQLESYDPPPEIVDLADRLREVGRFEVVYRTDRYGSFLALDEEAVLDHFDRFIEVFGEFAEIADNAETQRVVDDLQHVVENPQLAQLMAANVAKSIAGYHSAYGGLASVDEPLVVDSLLPNPIGGDDFPARQTFTVDDVSDEDGCVRTTLDVRPRPEPAQRIIAEFVTSLSPRDSADVEAEIAREFEGFEIVNNVHSSWDPGSTWMVDVETTQEVTTDTRERTDRITYTAV